MTLTSALCGFDIDELYAVRFDGAPVDGALIVRNCRAVNQGWEAGEVVALGRLLVQVTVERAKVEEALLLLAPER